MTAQPSPLDCAVYADCGAPRELAEYLTPAWREYLGPSQFIPTPVYQDPAAGPEPQPATTAAVGDWLDRQAAARALLLPSAALQLPAIPNHRLSAHLCEATNRWMEERWLDDGGPRLFGTIIASTQLPDAAAAEVRRAAKHERMIAVLLSANGLNKPFGHPIYHPIYEAAADLGLPLILHAGADSSPDTLTAPMAGGDAAFYSEHHLLSAQSLMTHIVSLVAQGVFEAYPGLRVLAIGGGVAWIPSLVWRFESIYLAFRREVPWLTASASEYLARNVRVGTYPLNAPTEPDRMAQLIGSCPELRHMLCYASGFPGSDRDAVATLEGQVPQDWLPDVLHANADALMAW